MKTIQVSLVGSILSGEDLAKDLFIKLLETYLDGDQEDDITLDFTSVLTIDPGFFVGFVLLCGESNVFGLDRLRNQIFFSGLSARDVESLYGALSPTRSQSVDSQDVVAQLRKLHEQRQKEIWGDSPVMRNAFEQVTKKLEQTLEGLTKVRK